MKKRNLIYSTIKKRNWFVVVIFVVIIVLLTEGYFLFFNENEEGFAGIMRDIVNKLTNDKPDSASQQIYSDRGSGGGSSSPGGDSAGAGVNQPTQEQTLTSGCTLQQIAYTIGNLAKNQTCNSYQNEKCIDKIVKCTASVINLDYGTSGIFEVKFLFFEQEKTMDDAFDSTFSSQILQPREEKVFNGQIQVTNQELAEKDIACYYQTIKIPEKEVC